MNRAEELAKEIVDRHWRKLKVPDEMSILPLDELLEVAIEQALKTYADERCKPLTMALNQISIIRQTTHEGSCVEIMENMAKNALTAYKSEGGAEK